MAKAIVDGEICSCEICGSQFQFNKRKSNRFCGMACYRAWQKGPNFIPGRTAKLSGFCKACHGPVYRRNASTKRNGDKSDVIFCNRDCYDKFRADSRAAYISNNSKRCKGCERTVRPDRSGAKTPEYCSMVCRIQHKQPDPQLCLNCGCCFSAIKWFKGRNKATRVAGAKTCSHRCNIEWIKRNPERKKKISNAFQGKKHPNWQGGSSRGVDGGYRGPGWAAIAEKARKRDGYVCQDCGITQEAHGKALEVHHKIPFNQYQGGNTKANRMSNLTTLCKSCHTTADWKWRRENAVQVIMSFDAA